MSARTCSIEGLAQQTVRFTCYKRGCTGVWGLRDSRCPVCGTPLHPLAWIKYYLGSFRQAVRRRTAIQCPACRHPVELSTPVCPQCNQVITPGATFELSVSPRIEALRAWVAGWGQRQIFLFQLGYLFGSCVLLWIALSFTERQAPDLWLRNAGLAVVFLSLFIVGLGLFVRRDFWVALKQRTSACVRFSLAANFLTALVVMHHLIGVYWGRSLRFAGTVGIMLVASWLVTRFLWSIAKDLIGVFDPPKTFHHSDRQGRSARVD